MQTLSDEQLKQTLEAYERNGGNQQATARELGLSRTALQGRIYRATTSGRGSHFIGGGNIPEGLQVSGTSTLIGTNGKPTMQWVKTKYASPEITISAIKEAFAEMATNPVYKPNGHTLSSSRLISVYPIADLHFGMYSWKEETGDDYDTDIASKTLLNAFIELTGRSIPSDLGIILNLGDFFHADNDEQETRRSGNKMDVDTRYARVLRFGVKLFIQVVELAKQKHKLLLVKSLPGNHDPYGSLALTTALAAYYSKDPRVVVDTEADPLWHYQFGRTLITAIHGDMMKMHELPGIVAARHPEEWGNTDWRYGYVGHWHKRKVMRPSEEFGGMEVEVFRTVAPKDAWNTQMGHVARRSLVAVTHDHNRGEVHRATVNVK